MSTEEKLLVKIGGLFFLAISMGGIFLSLFLFRLGSFKAVVSYGLISFIFIFILIFLSGYLFKKFSSAFVLRFGFLLFTIHYALVLILGESAINFLLILGIINGIASGCYWAAFNLTSYIATKEQTRNEFFGKLNFYMNIGSAAGPIMGGATINIIDLFSTKLIGYIAVFSLVALVFFAAYILSAKLPKHLGTEFTLRSFFNEKRKLSWKVVLSQQFSYGLFDVSFATLSGILMFLFLKDELILGTVTAVSAIIFAVANILAIKVLAKNKRAYILGMIISPIALLIFALQQNWNGIFSLIVISNLFLPLLNITTSKAIFDTIDSVKGSWQEKYHLLIERDSAIGAGRILTYMVILFWMTSGNQIAVSKSWILIVPIFPLLIGFFQVYKDSKVHL